MLDLLFYLIAAVLFGIATFNVPARVNLLAAGLFFAVLPHLINAFLDAGV
jgi:hypothetical protein